MGGDIHPARGGRAKPAPTGTALAPRPGELPLGTALCGRYRLERVIGRGGSAVVYLGTDVMLSQPVAVKVLLPDGINASPGAAESGIDLRTEAVAAMRLSHPNILRVYNYERDGDYQCLVMEYVPGENSHRVRARQPNRCMPASDTIRIGLECLQAIDHAHALGVLHHDIKPSNILLTRAGSAKLCDFGLASLTGRKYSGGKGLIAGTPGFIAPERVRGEPGDARSDLYGLGATLYALGNGRQVFTGTPKEVLVGHLRGQVPQSPVLPPLVDEVLQQALARRPDDRFQSAKEMHRALVEAKRDLSMTTHYHAAIVRAEMSMPPEGGIALAPTLRGPGPVATAGSEQAGTITITTGDFTYIEPTTQSHDSETRDRAAREAREAQGERAPTRRRARNTTDPDIQAGRRSATVDVQMSVPGAVADFVMSGRGAIEEVPVGGRGVAKRADRPGAEPERSVPPDMVWVAPMDLASAYAGQIHVPAFLLDRVPVTNAAFLEFVLETDDRPPVEWGRSEPPAHMLDLPVVGLDFARAQRYAEWAGKRLPTWVEWEAAARRPDGRTFPWGDWEEGRCNVRGEGPGELTPVDCYPQGASADGCLDLVGNAWEWTDAGPRREGLDPGYTWALGGSFRHAAVARGVLARTAILEVSHYPYLGFRCARDP